MNNVAELYFIVPICCSLKNLFRYSLVFQKCYTYVNSFRFIPKLIPLNEVYCLSNHITHIVWLFVSMTGETNNSTLTVKKRFEEF